MNEGAATSFQAGSCRLLLDDSGEKLLEARGQGRRTDGVVRRLDRRALGRHHQWRPGRRRLRPEPDGRAVPAVTEIARYSDLQGGDDKLTCAGTIDSFVRGAVGE